MNVGSKEEFLPRKVGKVVEVKFGPGYGSVKRECLAIIPIHIFEEEILMGYIWDKLTRRKTLLALTRDENGDESSQRTQLRYRLTPLDSQEFTFQRIEMSVDPITNRVQILENSADFPGWVDWQEASKYDMSISPDLDKWQKFIDQKVSSIILDNWTNGQALFKPAPQAN